MTSKAVIRKRLISLLMIVCMVACVISAAVVSASATINDAVRADTYGVVKINASAFLVFEKGDGVKEKYNIVEYVLDDSYYHDYGMTGTAFMINNDHIITCNHVVDCTQWEDVVLTVDKDGKEHTIAEYASYFKQKGVTIEMDCEIIVNKDVTAKADIITQSVQDDYAVLQLEKALSNRTILKLADSSQIMTTQTVYVLGFPGDVEKTEIISEHDYNRAYDSSDVSVSEGNIQKITTLNNTAVIQHSATTSGGNSGGPVVDDRGAVIGVHKWGSGTANEFHWATAINEVKKVLDSFNIEYYDADDPTPTIGAEETTGSNDNVGSEETTVVNGGGTVDDNKDDKKDDKENNNTTLIIIIAVIAIIVIFAIVVIIIIVINSKKKKTNEPAYRPPVTPPSVPPVTPPVSPGYAPSETTILVNSPAETTVLGGGADGFVIVRKNNNERITIKKTEFVIGKDKRSVDYFIANNSAVSRTHAKIRVRSGKCYIIDLGSTNCTYVNGVMLTPNQEKELITGDKIRIADEEFEFLG